MDGKTGSSITSNNTVGNSGSNASGNTSNNTGNNNNNNSRSSSSNSNTNTNTNTNSNNTGNNSINISNHNHNDIPASGNGSIQSKNHQHGMPLKTDETMSHVSRSMQMEYPYARTTENILTGPMRQDEFPQTQDAKTTFFSMPQLPSMTQLNDMNQPIQQAGFPSGQPNPEFATRLDGLLRFANSQFKDYDMSNDLITTPQQHSSMEIMQGKKNGLSQDEIDGVMNNGPTERTISKPSVDIPALRCVLARNILPSMNKSLLLSMFAKCGAVQHLSFDHLQPEGIVICQYFDVRHAKSALERLQNRTLGRNKVTVEGWEVPQEVLSRAFPPHSYPVSGRITIPNLPTTIRVDDVKRAMQQFGEIWSLHMGPMDLRKSSWTAILEYCDIRDAAQAYIAINHGRVSIQSVILSARAEIRETANKNSKEFSSTATQSKDSLNSLDAGSPTGIMPVSRATASNMSMPRIFNGKADTSSNATTSQVPKPFSVSEQLSHPTLDAMGLEEIIESYLNQQQSLIINYQQTLMQEMSQVTQVHSTDGPAKLANIQSDFQKVMQAQSKMMQQRKRLQEFIEAAKDIESFLPIHKNISKQQFQQNQDFMSKNAKQSNFQELSNSHAAPGRQAYNMPNEQHQQYGQHQQHSQQRMQSQQLSLDILSMEKQKSHGVMDTHFLHHSSSNDNRSNDYGKSRDHIPGSNESHFTRILHTSNSSAEGKPHSRDASNSRTKKRPYALFVDDILSGKDKRTTIMIRNIPLKYTQQMVLAEIDKTFKGLYDFFYLPMDLRRRCSVGYAFINFCRPISCATFYAHFNGRAWPKVRSSKKCNISYGRIQGQIDLIAHFKDSSIMKEDDDHIKPIVIKHPERNSSPKLPLPAANGNQQHLGGEHGIAMLKYTSASF